MRWKKGFHFYKYKNTFLYFSCNEIEYFDFKIVMLVKMLYMWLGRNGETKMREDMRSANHAIFFREINKAAIDTQRLF